MKYIIREEKKRFAVALAFLNMALYYAYTLGDRTCHRSHPQYGDIRPGILRRGEIILAMDNRQIQT